MTNPTSTTPKLSKNPSKAEEIEFVEQVAALVPDGAYLKELFTTQFVGWVSEQIKNDFPPNLAEWYFASLIEVSEKVGQIQAINQTFDNTLKAKDAQIVALNSLVDSLRSRNDALYAEIEGGRITRIDLQNRLSNADDDTEVLKAEVTALKASLYDWMTGARTR